MDMNADKWKKFGNKKQNLGPQSWMNTELLVLS
jgi:hypothetical protein